MIDPDCDLCRTFTRHEQTHGALVQDMLLGVLGDAASGPAICHQDGCWTLFCKDDLDEVEILCRHENWHEFLKLVSEWSDYDEGDSVDAEEDS